MPSEHAILSASGSHRWLACTPSARLEQEFSDTDSTASLEGTAAHSLAEHKLKKKLKMQSTRPNTIYDNDEMEMYTDDYSDYVVEQYTKAKRYDENAKVLIEQRLDFSCYVPEGFGTGDAVIVSKGKLHIIDLKYGLGVLVNAEKNPQMMLYALGALRKYEKEYEIKKVKLTIFQPRRENVTTWETTAAVLKKWANKILRPKAEMAYRGTGKYEPGSHCQFCKAAIKCRARAEEKLKLAKEEFKKPPLITDNEIESVLAKIPDIKKWCDDIMEYALEKAQNGKKWEGFKIVAGRGTRKYLNEEAVVEALNKAGYYDIYKKSLLPITEMEKLMTKKTFSEVLGKLVGKTEGKPTLVSLDDKRPELNTIQAKNEFKEEK